MSEVAVKPEAGEVQGFLSRMMPRDERTVVVLIIAAIFAILVLPPLVFLLKGALTVTEGGATRVSLARFGTILAQSGIWTSAFNSFVFALGSAGN